MLLYKIATLILLCLSHLEASTVEKPKGWLWYQDPVVPKEENKKPEKKENSISMLPKKLSATERLEAQKKDFEEAKALAILEPTLANVANAQKHHNFIITQATNFQKSWTMAEMIDPGYIPIATNPGAVKIREQQDEREVAEDLKILAKEFGLIFAFKKDCPYCHQFAPLVREFASKYGFRVQGLSKGEDCFEGMTCSKNEAALLAINPKLEFPMLYLANPQTNEVIPIARGFIGLDALMSNIKYAISYLKKEGQL